MTERGTEAQALRGFIFRPRVPSAALVGLDVNRTQLSYDPDVVEEDARAETDLRWAVTGFVNDVASGGPHLLIIGDLQARRAGWFAGCIVVGHVDFREPDDRPQSGETDLIEDYCAWVSSPLYDFAASRVRSLVSSSHGCRIEVATMTPLADLDSMTVGEAHPTADGEGFAAELTSNSPPD